MSGNTCSTSHIETLSASRSSSQQRDCEEHGQFRERVRGVGAAGEQGGDGHEEHLLRPPPGSPGKNKEKRINGL